MNEFVPHKIDAEESFESHLLGPQENAPASISYPYAVIKMEKREEPVLFN